MMEKKRSKSIRDIVFFLFAGVLGLIAVIIPPLITHGIRYYYHDPRYRGNVFPLAWAGYEGFSLVTAGLLVSVGILLGFLRQKKAWLWGIATMSLFPILAIADMIVDPSSHNLWPFEFIFYGIEALPAILGAYIGVLLKKAYLKKRKINYT